MIYICHHESLPYFYFQLFKGFYHNIFYTVFHYTLISHAIKITLFAYNFKLTKFNYSSITCKFSKLIFILPSFLFISFCLKKFYTYFFILTFLNIAGYAKLIVIIIILHFFKMINELELFLPSTFLKKL